MNSRRPALILLGAIALAVCEVSQPFGARAEPEGFLYKNGQLADTLSVVSDGEGAALRSDVAGESAPGQGLMGAPELSPATRERNTRLAAAADAGAALRETVQREVRAQEHGAALDVAGLRQSWSRFRRSALEIRQSLAKVGERVLELGLPPEIHARHKATLAAHDRGTAELESAINAVQRGEPGALSRVAAILDDSRFRYDPQLLHAAPPVVMKRVEAPRVDVDSPLPASSTKARAASPAALPTSLDLEPTVDVQITPEITAKATELGSSAAAIYDFVRNEVAFQPYLGSRKGSAETLRQMAGNDTDQASLLIALLRAAGVPSRYVRGTLEMGPEQAKTWLRVDDAATAASILTTVGLDGVAVVDGSTVVAVRSTHVWVEAYVPYANYRGIPNDTQGALWIPLAPSFKASTIQPGQDVLTPMAFDVDVFLSSYISASNPLTPIEQLAADIQAHLDTHDPGTTVEDVERTATIDPVQLGILPLSLPAQVLSEEPPFSELEETKRYKVRFRLYNGGTTFIDHTVRLPELIGTALTIEYVGATPADQATIDSFVTIYNTPPNLVHVRPILKQDGLAVASAVAGIGLGRTHSFDMEFIQPVGASNVQPLIQNQIIAGNGHAVAFDTFLDVREALFDGTGFSIGSDLETVLHDTAVDYLNRVDRGQERAQRLMKVETTQDVSEAIVKNSISVALSFGNPISFEWTGLVVDADRRIIGPFGVSGDPAYEVPYMIVSGMEGSLMENRVFEDIYEQEAVSTIKILALASDAAIDICTITSSIAADCPGTSQPTSVLSAINAALAAGHVVTIPKAPITVGMWVGTGYIDMDPSTGAAGYIISGGINGAVEGLGGGATVDVWPIILPCLFSTITAAEVLEPPTDSPDMSAVYCADGSHISFKIKMTIACDFLFGPDPPERDIERTLTTRSTNKQLGPGDYVLIVPVDNGPDVMREVTILGVREIKLSSSKAQAGMHTFPGHSPFPFVPSKNPGPGEHLAVFYKDAIDSSMSVQSFDVDAEAIVNTTKLDENDLSEMWTVAGPASAALDRTDSFEVKLENPTDGGVYHLELDLGSPCASLPASEANVVLPLAGAEVKDIVAADLIRADAFAVRVLARYNLLERNLPTNGLRWFNNRGAGDYLGRPDHPSTPTVRLYNQVASGGLGAVATWFGVPVRTAKMNNFMVAYGARKIGVTALAAWFAQGIGSINDSSASKSWDAGWAVAGGSAYASTASAMVEDIFDEADDKNQRLWPNPNVASNHVLRSVWSNADTQFSSPGFLEMVSP